ncbi:MAG: hypothetical protein JXA67_16460 [Micromonosporaceae bacterium]|nr:hypothetical protein [Micromonosporaceae bacterium]
MGAGSLESLGTGLSGVAVSGAVVGSSADGATVLSVLGVLVAGSTGGAAVGGTVTGTWALGLVWLWSTTYAACAVWVVHRCRWEAFRGWGRRGPSVHVGDAAVADGVTGVALGKPEGGLTTTWW